MAQPTPSNISLHPCSSKYDLEIQPEKPNQQKQYPSIYKDDEVVKGAQSTTKSAVKVGALQVLVPPPPTDITSRGRDDAEDESGRERLKRHRMEMGGRVWIPDTWGQENSLKNWIDCTSFDASLVNNTILSARAALMQQRRATTTRSTNNLTLHRTILENRC